MRTRTAADATDAPFAVCLAIAPGNSLVRHSVTLFVVFILCVLLKLDGAF